MSEWLINLWWGWQLVALFGVPLAALLLAVTINDGLDPASPRRRS